MKKTPPSTVSGVPGRSQRRGGMQSRQQAILDHLDLHESASYEELCRLLKTSSMTVRRDVEALSLRGIVLKTLGGASRPALPKSPLYESDFQTRLRQQREEKRAMALEVLGLLDARQSIFLDAGTTMIEVAKVLGHRVEGCNLITNSLLVCSELTAGAKNKITMLGGDFSPESSAFTGLLTEENAGSYYYDVALFSTKGFVIGEGTFESSLENSRIKQIVAPRAKRVILLADHTKFGRRALRKVLDVSAIHCVITDGKTPAEVLRSLERKQIQVIVCGQAPAKRRRL